MACISGCLTINYLVDEIGEEIYFFLDDEKEPLFILRPKKYELVKMSDSLVDQEILKVDIHDIKIKKGQCRLLFKNKKHLAKVKISVQPLDEYDEKTHQASIDLYQRHFLCNKKEVKMANLRAIRHEVPFVPDPISLGF